MGLRAAQQLGEEHANELGRLRATVGSITRAMAAARGAFAWQVRSELSMSGACWVLSMHCCVAPA